MGDSDDFEEGEIANSEVTVVGPDGSDSAPPLPIKVKTEKRSPVKTEKRSPSRSPSRSRSRKKARSDKDVKNPHKAGDSSKRLKSIDMFEAEDQKEARRRQKLAEANELAKKAAQGAAAANQLAKDKAAEAAAKKAARAAAKEAADKAKKQLADKKKAEKEAEKQRDEDARRAREARKQQDEKAAAKKQAEQDRKRRLDEDLAAASRLKVSFKGQVQKAPAPAATASSSKAVLLRRVCLGAPTDAQKISRYCIYHHFLSFYLNTYSEL